MYHQIHQIIENERPWPFFDLPFIFERQQGWEAAACVNTIYNNNQSLQQQANQPSDGKAQERVVPQIYDILLADSYYHRD
jgi:hypothetical protein